MAAPFSTVARILRHRPASAPAYPAPGGHGPLARMAAQIVASAVAGTSFQRQRNFLELQLPWKRPPEAESGFESQKFPSVTSGPYSCTRFVPQPFVVCTSPEPVMRSPTWTGTRQNV